MFWVLALVSYFLPLSSEYLLKADLINPNRDRLYLQEIPFTTNRYLRFWNLMEIKDYEGKASLYFIKDSLKSPEVLLYSLRGENSSEIGGFLKTPINRIENQTVLLYSNLKGENASSSVLIFAIKHIGKTNFNISYGQTEGKSGYAISSTFKNVFLSYAQGDFKEAKAGFKEGKVSAFYRLDGKISSAIFIYNNLSLGLSYHEKIFPYLSLEQTFNFFTFQIEYGAKNFHNRIEKRFYGNIKFVKNCSFAGIEGKIGKEGVFLIENGTLHGQPYTVSFFGGLQKEKAQIAFYYFLSRHGKLFLRASHNFNFKKGELALEPEAEFIYEHLNGKISGNLGLSLFLFRAMEARLSYDFSKGAFVGIGVNLFD